MSKSREYDQRYQDTLAEIDIVRNAAEAAICFAEETLGLTAITKEITLLEQRMNDLVKQSDKYGADNKSPEATAITNDIQMIVDKTSALEAKKNNILNNKSDPLIKEYENVKKMLEQSRQMHAILIYKNDTRKRLEIISEKATLKLAHVLILSWEERKMKRKATKALDNECIELDKLIIDLKSDAKKLTESTREFNKLIAKSHLKNINTTHEELVTLGKSIEVHAKDILNELAKQDPEMKQNNTVLTANPDANVSLYNELNAAIQLKDNLNASLDSDLKNLQRLEAFRNKLGARVNVYQAEGIGSSDTDREKNLQASVNLAWTNLDLANNVYKEKQLMMIEALENLQNISLRAKMVIENKASLDHDSIPAHQLEEKTTLTFSNEQGIKLDLLNNHNNKIDSYPEAKSDLENASDDDDGLDDAISSMLEQQKSYGPVKRMGSDFEAAVSIINASKASLEQANNEQVEHNPDPELLAMRCK
jgi:hypothetical protein